RAVPSGNLHVTLAFLGAVPESRLVEVRAIGARVAGTISSESRLSFTKLEYWTRAGALCATAAAGDPSATALAAGVKSALVAAGFAPDLKPFRPHVTLARKVPRADGDVLSLSPIVWTLEAFALVDSRTEAAGAIYTVLESFRIGSPTH